MPDEPEWAEFLDRLIHDLREPLRSIHAFSELLREGAPGSLSGDAGESLAQILSGTTRIRTLIEGLSGYALALRDSGNSAGSGQVPMQLAFDLAADTLAAQIHDNGATVTAGGLPRVNIPLERQTQLLENLIGNALKFRSEAAPVVHVSARSENDEWTIQVEDNGFGIDPADCERVFLPFVRVHGRKYPGAGLGLAICRKIVEAHGGEIHLSPRAGGGSVCTFRVPA